MVEVTFVPRVKTETATIHSPVSKCGDNWWRDVKVRAPYKGVDKAYRTLPSLGEPAQIERFDIEFPNEISVDLERVRDFAIKSSAKLSDRQRKNVNKMLKRAGQYLADARKLQSTWARGFSATRLGKIPAWPFGGQPQGGINKNIEEGHARDEERWKQLIRAALRNVRCAEEVAKKATIRSRNKQTQKGRAYAPSEVVSNKGIRSDLDDTDTVDDATLYDELEEGEIDLEDADGGEILSKRSRKRSKKSRVYSEVGPIDPILTMTWDPNIQTTQWSGEQGEGSSDQDQGSQDQQRSPKKKNDNTILIAGAAAIGILALGKK